MDMFYKYIIKENVLYLYVDDRCEIGSLFNNDKNESIIRKIRSYIKDNKVHFSGTKVVLLLSGLMLGTVYLNANAVSTKSVYSDNKYVYNVVDKSVPINSNNVENADLINDETIPPETSEKETSNEVKTSIKNVNNEKSKDMDLSSNVTNNRETIITLYRKNNEVLNIDLEEYLIGVVGAEMPASFDSEALKAQAVVARTYTLKLLESNRKITDDVSTQVYKNNSELQTMWGKSYEAYYNKIKNAVSATNGLCIKYNGSLIDAVYHSTSNGYTEDSVNVWGNSVPYLKSVTSPWDTSASSYLREISMDFNQISNLLGINFNDSSSIEIVSRDESGRVSNVKFDEKEFTGVELRNLLGLRSADFDVLVSQNNITFTTKGYGHGVGMSQYGANGMAKAGYSYDQILRYYYSGVEIVQND